MPVIAPEMVTYKSAGMPGAGDNASSSGGTIDTGSGPVSQTATNAVMPTEEIPVADEVWRYKLIRKNTNATDTLFAALAWIYNGMPRTHAAGLAAVQCAVVGETGKIMVVGKVSGVYQSDYITLDGTTNVLTGAVSFDANTIKRGEKLSAGGAITLATNGSISLIRGVTLGFIPQGYSHVTAEFDLGLDPSQNNALAAANRLTNPAGVTFPATIPVSEATAIAVPGTNIAPGSWIGYWPRFTRYGGIVAPVGYTFPLIMVKGRDA